MKAATTTSTTAANASAKSQGQATSSHQLKIDRLLDKKITNIHVIKPHPKTTTNSDNIKTDILLSSDTATSPDASRDDRPCHVQLCHTNDISDDVMDCLFDDIDYHDLFDSEPLPLVTEDNVVTPRQQHEGSCDLEELSCDALRIDDTLIEILDDDDDDDVTDMSTISCSKFNACSSCM